MNNQSKIMLAILIVLALILSIKSLVIDPYKPIGDEKEFYEEVEKIIEEKYSSWVYKYVVDVKIVNMKEMTEAEKTLKDDDGNEYIAKGKYKAKVRKYIVSLLPFSEEWIVDVKE